MTVSLFSTLRVGRLLCRNRIFMAPMTRNRASPSGVLDPLAARYYGQRASAGLIVSEATAVSRQGSGYPLLPGLFTDDQVLAWRGVTRVVHDAGGSIFVQLYHTGRVGHSSLTGEAPVSASAVALREPVLAVDLSRRPAELPRALHVDEIKGIVAAFTAAAVRAVDAGADGVELHAANGYLLDQFLRDGVNQRADAYGGSVGRRLRLLLEVVEACSQAIGAERLAVRLSPFNAFNEMSDSDPVRTFTAAAAALSGKGLAYLHVVRDHAAHPDAPAEALLGAMRRSFGGPVVANRGYDADSGAAALTRGDADAIAFGVPFLANPDLVCRLRHGGPLNVADAETFYGGGATGYIDYPIAEDLAE